MSEWKEYKLGELGTLQRGKSKHRPRYAYHLYGGKYPFIQTGEIREAKKYITKFQNTYNEEGLKQSKLWPKGTLCITIAANIAELAILDFDACFPDSVLGFIVNEKIADRDFVYYTLTHFQRELKHIGEGSVQDNINMGTFERIVFPIPQLKEQKEIATILGNLDSKLDLLNRQIENLEKMAEILFRKWFVEEADKDWEERSLGEIVDFIVDNRGKTPPIVEYKTEYPLIEVNALNANSCLIDYSVIRKYVNKDTYETWFRKYLEIGDIIISTVGTIGVFSIHLSKKGCIAQNLIALRSNSISSYFIYNFLKVNKENVLNLDIGGVQPSIKVPHLLDLRITLPPFEMIREYDNIVVDFYKKIKNNHDEIQTVTKLRDTLLPKLMSGEVRVN